VLCTSNAIQQRNPTTQSNNAIQQQSPHGSRNKIETQTKGKGKGKEKTKNISFFSFLLFSSFSLCLRCVIGGHFSFSLNPNQSNFSSNQRHPQTHTTTHTPPNTPHPTRTQPDLGPVHHVLGPFGGVQFQPGSGVVVVGRWVVAFAASFCAAATQC